MTGMKMQKTGNYEKDLDMLMSLLSKGEETDMFSHEKGSKGTMLYELEAEEIDLKNLEAHA